MRNLHTQLDRRVCAWYFKKSVFKTIIYLIVLLSPWFYFHRVKVSFHIHWFSFVFSPFRLLILLVCFLHLKTDPSKLFVHLARDPLSFLAFLGALFSGKISLTWLKKCFHRVIFKMRLILHLHLLIPIEFCAPHFT
jgi:hypothetical protein